MPHDSYGHTLNVGDVVYVPAKVIEIHQTENYCNVTLATERPMAPSNHLTTINLNAQQVEKIFNRQIPPAHSAPKS